MSNEACGTNTNGQHYIRRDAMFFWCHSAEMRESDQDCSDMSDAEFQECVDAHTKPADRS